MAGQASIALNLSLTDVAHLKDTGPPARRVMHISTTKFAVKSHYEEPLCHIDLSCGSQVGAGAVMSDPSPPRPMAASWPAA